MPWSLILNSAGRKTMARPAQPDTEGNKKNHQSTHQNILIRKNSFKFSLFSCSTIFIILLCLPAEINRERERETTATSRKSSSFRCQVLVFFVICFCFFRRRACADLPVISMHEGEKSKNTYFIISLWYIYLYIQQLLLSNICWNAHYIPTKTLKYWHMFRNS